MGAMPTPFKVSNTAESPGPVSVSPDPELTAEEEHLEEVPGLPQFDLIHCLTFYSIKNYSVLHFIFLCFIWLILSNDQMQVYFMFKYLAETLVFANVIF